MRAGLLLLSLLALSLCCSSVSAQDSFCVKYSKALFGVSNKTTNYQLLNAVVARVVVGCNNNLNAAFGVPGVQTTQFAAYSPQACGNAGITVVPGLVADPLNAPFFAGTSPAFPSQTNAAALNAFAGVNQTGFTSIRFVGVSGRTVAPFAAALGGPISATMTSEGLVQHLISFFGRDLGCQVDMTQNTVMTPATAFIGKYNGVVNMTQVHVGMAINWAVWNEFANTFVLALQSFGVTQADIDGTIVPYLSQFLRGPQGTSNVICNQADCPCAPQFNTVNGACVVPPATPPANPPSFCAKYASALFPTAPTRNAQYQLLNAVVARVTVGCNNNLAAAFGIPGVAGTAYAAYAPQTCGNNGVVFVPGLVQDPLNAPFFAGTAPAYPSATNATLLNAFGNVAQTGFPSIRFVGVSGQTVTPFPAALGGNISATMISEGLITHLISFFGIALGCDVDLQANTNIVPGAAFIGRYNGAPSMTQVHAGMAINQAVWNEFSNTFLTTLQSFGVTQFDITNTIQPYLAMFLRGPAGTDNVICNQADCMCAPQYNLVNGNCVVPTGPPTPPTTPPFCTKYAAALFNVANAVTEFRLIQAVVARVILGCNNDPAQRFGVPGATGDLANFAASPCQGGLTKVPGLVEDPLNSPFFNGFGPSYTSVTQAFALNDFAGINQATFVSTPFVTVSGHSVTPLPAALGGKVALPNMPGFNMTQEGLITHLIAFFARDLGCSSIDLQHDTTTAPLNNARIGRYNGATSMFAVHQTMKITMPVWNEFVNTFVQTLLSFGVTQDDITNTIMPYLNGFLAAPNGVNDKMICNQPDCACATGFQPSPNGAVGPTGCTAGGGPGTNGQGGNKIGQAAGLVMSPIIVLVATVVALLFA